MCLVGSRHFNVFGSHGSDAYVDMVHYSTLEECCDDLRQNKGALRTALWGCQAKRYRPIARHLQSASSHAGADLCAGCEIVGIEIVDEAKPLQSFPFRGNTAFMLGNEVGCCCRGLYACGCAGLASCQQHRR